MALEPGHGSSAVPVRATILSVAVAIAALCSTTVIAESLNRLIDTPALSGLTYDALVIVNSEAPDARAQTLAAVRSSDSVGSYTNGDVGDALVGGRDIFVFALRQKNGIRFSVIRGVSPSDTLHGSSPEIAVGPTTLRRMHWHIGQMVPLKLLLNDSQPEITAVITGTAAMPALPFRQDEPGDGVVMTLDSWHVVVPDPTPGEPCCFVRFKPGVDPQAARTQLEAKGLQVFVRNSRADLKTLSKIATLPTTFAYIIGAGAAIVIAYALLTATYRRRRDLAVLKVFGFVRGQVRRTVAWQASVLTVAAVVIGLPVGVIVGRFGWRLFADEFGVVPNPATPVPVLILLFPVAVVLANVIAILPARAAARTKPALVLREE